ncbi:hypothetical protein JTE90_028025 [Oedothorax gibbosus]|uniref:Coiled-coil domain-containing protein 51 n=1 Tax=Oedothorax gibbosus TaxID=931172 RepID=A0AAV6VGB5_9ARAC|nr:hypothetical protein JTE90_028025 [Oedothorax gibbosus]
MHEAVLETQKNIQSVQEKRRKVQEDLFVAQKKLQESRNLLHKTAMDDSMYITVVTQVHEMLKEQGHLQDTFSSYDQQERELQSNLAISINNSQDHERTYREKTKYLSLVTGLVGGLLGFLGSSINNWRLRREIKSFANNISGQVVALQENVKKLKGTDPKYQETLSQMRSQQELFDKSIVALNTLITSPVSRDIEVFNEPYLQLKFDEMSNRLEEDWDSKLRYHTSINIAVISSLLLVGAVVLYVIDGR